MWEETLFSLRLGPRVEGRIDFIWQAVDSVDTCMYSSCLRSTHVRSAIQGSGICPIGTCSNKALESHLCQQFTRTQLCSPGHNFQGTPSSWASRGACLLPCLIPASNSALWLPTHCSPYGDISPPNGKIPLPFALYISIKRVKAKEEASYSL